MLVIHDFFQFLGDGPMTEAIVLHNIGTCHFLKLHDSMYQHQK